VVAGTTLGMMLADVPAVFFGEKRILRRVPAKDGAPGRGGELCAARRARSHRLG